MAHSGLRPAAARVFLIAWLVYAATTGASLSSSDAVMTYAVTESIVMRGSIAVPEHLRLHFSYRGPDGQFYSPFGIAQSLYNLPFFVAGDLAQRVLGLQVGKPDTITKATVAVGNTVAAAAFVTIAFLLAVAISHSTAGGAVAALLLAFATPVWVYARSGFNAPLAGCAVTLALYATWLGVRDRSVRFFVVAGSALGAALLTRHELGLLVVPVGIVTALLLRRSASTSQSGATPSRALVAIAAPYGIALVIWGLYNYARFGDVLDSGYSKDETAQFGLTLGTVMTGVAGLLISPAASLIIYAPPAALGVFALTALWRRQRSAFAVLTVPFLAMLLLYGAFESWSAGRSYGPRYLVPLLPCLVVPLAVWWPARRSWIALALAAGVAAQVPAVLVDYSKASIAHARSLDATGEKPDPERRWRDAPLVVSARLASAVLPDNLKYLIGSERPPQIDRSADPMDRNFAQQFAFSLDFWWLYLYYMGVWPAPVAALAGILPLAIAVALAKRLSRVLAP